MKGVGSDQIQDMRWGGQQGLCLSNQIPWFWEGTLRKEQVLDGKNHKQERGSILLHAEPRWGAKSDSKNWVLCSVYTIYENVPQSDHLISAWKTRQEIIIVVATISGTLTNYTRHYGKHCTYIAVILRHITWQMVTIVTRFPQYFCELLQPVNIAIWMKT